VLKVEGLHDFRDLDRALFFRRTEPNEDLSPVIYPQWIVSGVSRVRVGDPLEVFFEPLVGRRRGEGVLFAPPPGDHRAGCRAGWQLLIRYDEEGLVDVLLEDATILRARLFGVLLQDIEV